MNILFIFLSVTGIMFISATISQIMVNYKDYKYFKATYEVIISKQYVLVHRCKLFKNDEIWTLRHKDHIDEHNNSTYPEIIFFIKNNSYDSIKLLSPKGGHYIHSSIMKLDLYATYYFEKICKAMSTHDINAVELMDLTL